ncbi:hypothetical protein [Terriglobus sp.]|uniref:hypothetical protein n=1 Tax=Terriglobus sp. TaxID=1889013 RepID=UPI003B00D012
MPERNESNRWKTLASVSCEEGLDVATGKLHLFGILNRVPRRFALAALCTGMASFGLILLSMGVPGPGITLFRSLERATGEAEWTTALAYALMVLTVWLAGAGILLSVIRFVVRPILLWRSYPSEGVVRYVGQTGSSVNNMPVMRLELSVSTPNGPVMATVRKLMDISRIPRMGEVVAVNVSSVDPTCVGLR